MSKWLSIVGIGEDGLEGLAPAARALIASAEVLVGGERHLAVAPPDGRERLQWTNPLSCLVDEIVTRRGRPLCVLATGDPMHFGIGVTLARRLPIEEMSIIPAPSAFSLVCARLGWPRADVATLTLHGRPLELLNAYLQPAARVIALSEDGKTPARVARLLNDRGFGGSRIHVLEHLGGAKERVVSCIAREWRQKNTADLNTIAIECVADTGAMLLPRVPGLPDAAFHHDGQLTKREVRAVTLAALAPVPGQLLWDVGAGCGSVAIEWMRAAANSRAIAIESRADRRRLIADNAMALGAPKLDIVEGRAPEALVGLPAPDAVFVGGSVSRDGVLVSAWEALRPGGRLVANAVTMEGEAALVAWRARNGGELTRIAISRAAAVGAYNVWRPAMAVTQLSATKS